MANGGAAVDVLCDVGLQPGFRDVHVDRQIETVRDVAAGPQEAVGTVMRNRRRDGECDSPRQVRARRGDRCDRGEGVLAAGQFECADGLAEVRRQGRGQARDRLKQVLIRDHRREHGAHAGVRVGAGGGHETCHGGARKFVEQIEAGGAALRQHVGGAEQRGEVDRIRVARPGEPGGVGERGLQRPCVGDALHQVGVAVRVGIDQAGDDQPAARIVRARGGARERSGCADRGDPAARDQQIAVRGVA